MGSGDRFLQEFGVIDNNGDLVIPDDVAVCPYCGYAGDGFNDLVCPKCKRKNEFVPSKEKQQEYLEILESGGTILPPEQLEALTKGRRTQWNNRKIYGIIGEMWYANELRNKGYKVRVMMYYSFDSGKMVFNEESIKELLTDYKNKNKLFKILDKFSSGFPDLICLKDDKVSFIEVKTNNSQLNQNQEEVIKALKKAKYSVKVIRLKVDYSVDIEK